MSTPRFRRASASRRAATTICTSTNTAVAAEWQGQVPELQLADDAAGRRAEWPVFAQLALPFVTLHEDAAERAVGDVYFDEKAFSRWGAALSKLMPQGGALVATGDRCYGRMYLAVDKALHAADGG